MKVLAIIINKHRSSEGQLDKDLLIHWLLTVSVYIDVF